MRATSWAVPERRDEFLSRVHALVGEPQRLRRVRCLLGQDDAAHGGRDLEAVAALTEHGVGGAEHRLARVIGGEQHAEIVTAHPEGGRRSRQHARKRETRLERGGECAAVTEAGERSVAASMRELASIGWWARNVSTRRTRTATRAVRDRTTAGTGD